MLIYRLIGLPIYSAEIYQESDVFMKNKYLKK